eukprot:1160129-Pelagomonas_calceolata.AAC.1
MIHCMYHHYPTFLQSNTFRVGNENEHLLKAALRRAKETQRGSFEPYCSTLDPHYPTLNTLSRGAIKEGQGQEAPPSAMKFMTVQRGAQLNHPSFQELRGKRMARHAA